MKASHKLTFLQTHADTQEKPFLWDQNTHFWVFSADKTACLSISRSKPLAFFKKLCLVVELCDHTLLKSLSSHSVLLHHFTVLDDPLLRDIIFCPQCPAVCQLRPCHLKTASNDATLKISACSISLLRNVAVSSHTKSSGGFLMCCCFPWWQQQITDR